MKNIERDNKSDIINSLLRTNFDIKDESLDIDLSVCAAIPDSGTAGIPLWLSDMEETADYFKATTSESIPVTLANCCESSNELEPVQITDTKKDSSHEIMEKISIKKESVHTNLSNTKIKTEPNIDINKNNENISFHMQMTNNEISTKSNINSSPKSQGERRNILMDCPDCGKSLKLGSMWMHRKIHNTNSKRYNCDICGQKFVQKVNLTNHLKLHNAEKSFECPECQKTFPERSHMIRHQKYHSDLRPYKCEKCGKMYKTERCLKVHSLVHLDKRPFVCSVCNKSFLSNSKLKQHSNIHTGERPYKCKYCSRDFTNFPNWLKHTRRRHNVDHKTGEVLQKIPSYCSKQKKSKQPIEQTQKIDQPTKELLNAIQIKREPSENNVPILFSEKKKISKIFKEEVKDDIKVNINDLHSLSLTSAEDLIMEQALELEEAGYFNNNRQLSQISLQKRANFLDPDNRLFEALYSSENSPLSSPSSTGDCKPLLIPILPQSSTLPPITAVSSNNYFITTNLAQNGNNAISHQILPSMVEAFLGFQKIQSSDM
ncbi:zinc finger protein 62-like [Condylostylus longicornis]|uniref:zinc finger protein 62-like n=1 Tax=Condylostylus longicornis TaxID=2530218 RepID=UPI00244E2264|nr:zinc finger protein 62-like [Condylostylus longicornis]